MSRVGALLALLLAGPACQSDVRLGALEPGVQPGPDADVFDAPSATGTALILGDFLPPQCDGSLVDRESAFDGWTAAEADLVGGSVELDWRAENLVRVTGDPIVAAYMSTALDLRDNVVPEMPAGILASIVSVTGTAPDGMTKQAGMLSIDTTTLDSSGAYGQAGMLYADATGGDGTCAVAVDIRFQH
jgi:hypothetical protein